MTQEALKLARQLLWRYRHETPIGNQPYMICHAADEAFERIDEALAKEKALQALHSENERLGLYKDAYAEQEPVVVCCQQYDTCLKPCTPRGEHLAQRTWVGLTKKEVHDLYDADYVVFHQRIEAKLKEKNGA